MALEQKFTIQAGYIEIYNEQVHDLLDLSSGVLGIRGDISNGFFVERQLFVECEDIKDLMAVLQEGNKNRSISSHELNCDSSRSHCIFTVKINGQKDSILKKGRISFVDLAGSGKLRDSKTETKKVDSRDREHQPKSFRSGRSHIEIEQITFIKLYKPVIISHSISGLSAHQTSATLLRRRRIGSHDSHRDASSSICRRKH